MTTQISLNKCQVLVWNDGQMLKKCSLVIRQWDTSSEVVRDSGLIIDSKLSPWSALFKDCKETYSFEQPYFQEFWYEKSWWGYINAKLFQYLAQTQTIESLCFRKIWLTLLYRVILEFCDSNVFFNLLLFHQLFLVHEGMFQKLSVKNLLC